uniref:mRNA-decapping enzyme 2 n=1 Tax=Trichuris muris TaxID=70415 RepID=A0A5S6R4G4_TRIMR
MPQIGGEVLNELCSRFLINIPDEEKVDPVRVCFQIEQAHWFYVDYLCRGENACSLREFMSAIFAHCPFLRPYSPQVTEVMGKWRQYKSGVPLFGAILVNEACSEVLLVQGYYAKSSWGFPKGKLNENESPAQCAVREVLEEVGYDISHKINTAPFTVRRMADSNLGLFLITGVETNFNFFPQTRNEIRRIQWFPIDSLPCNKNDTSIANFGFNPRCFFMVFPFVTFIKRYTSSAWQGGFNGARRVRSVPRLTDKRRRKQRALKALTCHHYPRVRTSSFYASSSDELNETPTLARAQQSLLRINPRKLFDSPEGEEATTVVAKCESLPLTSTVLISHHRTVEVSSDGVNGVDGRVPPSETKMESNECATYIKVVVAGEGKQTTLPRRTAPRINLAKAWQQVNLKWEAIWENLLAVRLETTVAPSGSSSSASQEESTSEVSSDA